MVCRREGDAYPVTLVWLSPGLPADRAELAAALPSDLALVPANPAADSHSSADVGVLPVGSLCVATVFEHDLLAQLATRPAGVRLLVVGPPDRLADSPNATAPAVGRPADVVTAAASVPELVTAIGHAAGASPTSPYLPVAPVAPGDAETVEGAPGKFRTPLRTRLIATAAVLLGLAVGGVVIGATEGTSAATANGGAGGFGGGAGGGGGGFGQFPGGAGGTGAAGGTATAFEKQILACLRQQGIKTPTNQLLQNQQDPALRQAFLTCIQQLRNGGAAAAPVPGAGPGGPSSQITGRP